MNSQGGRKLTVDWGREIHSTVPSIRQKGDDAPKFHRGYIQIGKTLEKYRTGSAYEGCHNSLGFAGFGVYSFAHGATYEGYFKDGQFHGDGTITYPKGQQLDGTWDNGKLNSSTFRFEDGLEFQSDWNYCEPPDRTFQIEAQQGLQAPKQEILSNKRTLQLIPKFCFDTGNGYYKPQTKIIYNLQHQIDRICPLKEEDIILRHFRQFADVPVGLKKELYEHWTSGRSEEIENITKRMKKKNLKKKNTLFSDLRIAYLHE